MCRELLANGVRGLHFCTLNMERSVREILLQLGLISELHLHRDVPWVGARTKGKTEAVRPIYWANRHRTYISRTEDWDSFPNGRWGDAASPAFVLLGDYHLTQLYSNSEGSRKQEWGTPLTVQDIAKVFVQYLSGEISRLPWNDTSLASESSVISDNLKKINLYGFLSINSQPAVNGVPSDHPVHGWGGPRGYIYQKAYLEFFTSLEELQKLKALIPKYPTLDYQAINLKGDNAGTLTGIAAVTWGVFPGSEIKQPTVVDPNVFCNIWKQRHSQWSSLYEKDSPSQKLLTNVVDTYYLVTLIENNYVNGDIFAIFNEIIGPNTKSQ